MGKLTIRRIVNDGMLAGVYVVLTFLSFNVGNLKIGLSSLAIVLTSLLYGPLDGAIVGLLGATLNQFRTYGFTLTTPIWIIAPALRGLIIGIFAFLYKRKEKDLIDNTLIYFLVLILASFVTTLANTLALYLDALIIGYSYTFLILELLSRIGLGFFTCLIVGLCCLPLYKALKSITK
ncbi:MAG TPA: hypothetical protein DD377_06595 [Firmicutes bacterium]|nr:hypothetical protein [Bacillota bacterium]HBM70979.1 hypothetical protein [Bacillota bacterium]